MRPQADALGQNLPHRAISSAVEHLLTRRLSLVRSQYRPSQKQVLTGFSTIKRAFSRIDQADGSCGPQPLQVDALALSKGLTPWKIGAGPQLW